MPQKNDRLLLCKYCICGAKNVQITVPVENGVTGHGQGEYCSFTAHFLQSMLTHFMVQNEKL